MPDTFLCPYCSNETPTEYNYCANCESQVKCKNEKCGSVLVANKTKCLKCGEAVDAVTALPLNKFSHTEEQTGGSGKNASFKRKTEFQGSDFAVAHVGNILASHMSGQSSSQNPPARYIVNPPTNKAANRTGDLFVAPPNRQISSLDAPVTDEDSHVSVTEPEPIASENFQNSTETNVVTTAKRLFEQDGEFLTRLTKDYKGKKWSDQQRRFVLMYIFCYSAILGKPVPKKEHLKVAAEKSNIYDKNNFATYVDQLLKSDLSEKSDGTITLSSDGQAKVKAILADMDNPEVKEGYAYWSRDTKTEAKRHYLSKEDKTKLDGWSKEIIDLGGFDIVQVQRAVDYAMVAVWLLTVKMDKKPTVKWNEAFYFLKSLYPNISASAEAFSRAMSSESNDKFFRTSQDDSYFLSDEGRKYVEKLVLGKSAPSTGSDDKQEKE